MCEKDSTQPGHERLPEAGFSCIVVVVIAIGCCGVAIQQMKTTGQPMSSKTARESVMEPKSDVGARPKSETISLEKVPIEFVENDDDPSRENPDSNKRSPDGTLSRTDHEGLLERLAEVRQLAERIGRREHKLRRLIKEINQGWLKLSISAEGRKQIHEFVYVPSGTFMMGRTEQDAREANLRCGGMHHSWSVPQYPVRVVGGFFIGTFEVTRGDWREFLKATAKPRPPESRGTRPQSISPVPSDLESNLPVTNVTWFEAMNYCRWISEKTGRSVRLPSETEWEWAARGYASFAHSSKDGKPLSSSVPLGAYPVGSQPSNFSWCGVSDLNANVREWCVDVWDENLYRKRADSLVNGGGSSFRFDPISVQMNRSDAPRVIRGGDSLNDTESNQEAATRRWKTPATREETLGFRLLIPVDPGAPL